MEFFEDPIKIWELKDLVLEGTNLADLMREYGLKLEQKNSGQFVYRTHCPFHKGKTGSVERTPSFFVSNNNSFYCFGCSISGSVIDFVSLMDGTPPSIALAKLAKRIGLIDKNGKWDSLNISSEHIPALETKTIEEPLFEISEEIYKYIRKFANDSAFEKEFKWAEKVAAKVDEIMSMMSYEDFDEAKNLYETVKKSIKIRLRNKGV